MRDEREKDKEKADHQQTDNRSNKWAHNVIGVYSGANYSETYVVTFLNDSLLHGEACSNEIVPAQRGEEGARERGGRRERESGREREREREDGSM